MKNVNAAVRKLKSLLKSAGGSQVPEAVATEDPIVILVQSFLLWEATTEKADTAYRKVEESIVDFNDLRVSMAAETVEIIGQRYPLAQDRSHRLRAALRDVYLREHSISLDRLQSFGKREVKKYLESIDGIVPYVSARVSLLCFGAHSIPVDEQLRTRLLEEDVVDEGMDVVEVAAWLTRHVKATEGVQAHFDLQAMIDEGGSRTRRRKTATNGKTAAGKASGTKKKTRTKKKTTGKTAGRA